MPSKYATRTKDNHAVSLRVTPQWREGRRGVVDGNGEGEREAGKKREEEGKVKKQADITFMKGDVK